MSTWGDDGISYDPGSVMHYPWYGFLTSDASAAGLSAMTDKFTGVPVQKPRQVNCLSFCLSVFFFIFLPNFWDVLFFILAFFGFRFVKKLKNVAVFLYKI